MRNKAKYILALVAISTSMLCLTGCGDEEEEHVVVNCNTSAAITGGAKNDSTNNTIIVKCAVGIGTSASQFTVGIQYSSDPDLKTDVKELHTTETNGKIFSIVMKNLSASTKYYYRACVHISNTQSYIGQIRSLTTDPSGYVDIEKTKADNRDIPELDGTDITTPPTNEDDQDPNNLNANTGSDETVKRLEMPKIDTQYDYICHKLSNGDVNYTILYNKKKMHAVWVAYTYDSKSAQKNWTSRTEAWSGEPFYDNDKNYQLSTGTFGGGYARGHICGSAERYYSKEANEQTFYMSNMSPMQSAFNSEYWGEIEDKARDNWGRAVTTMNSSFYKGTLYLVKGGTLEDDRIIEYRKLSTTNGKSVNVAVPKYYWMACLFISKDGSARSIGFWLEHKDYKNTSESALTSLRRGAACSIDELESKTGLDFFCNLNDQAESMVESTYDISLWPGL